MVHIVQRIVHGNADDGAANSQHNEAHTALEQGDKAQGKHGSGTDGQQNPEHVREAFVAEPEDKGNKNQRDGKRQQGVFFDAGGILYRHFRGAGRSEGYLRILCPDTGLGGIDIGREDCILTAFTASVGRMEQDDSGAAICCKQAIFNELRCSAGLIQALQDGRKKPQRIRAQVPGLEGTSIERQLVLLHLLRHIAGCCEKGIHARIVLLFQEIGPVATQKVQNGQDGGIVRFRR